MTSNPLATNRACREESGQVTDFLDRNQIFVRSTPSAHLCVGWGRRGELIKRLDAAEALLKAGFDPSQVRDDHGRWAREGEAQDGPTVQSEAIGAPTAPSGTIGGAAQSGAIGIPAASGAGSRWLLRSMAPRILAALSEFAEALPGPVAILGFYFIPLGRHSNVNSDTLPDHPDIQYHDNGDTGTFSLYRNGVQIFAGTDYGDGIIRDAQHNPIGRHVDGAIVIDQDALSKILGEKAKPQSRADAGATAMAQARPKLCPNPSPDVPHGARPEALAYEDFIHHLVNPATPIPLGYAVYLPDPTGGVVAFDDCDQKTGTMIEAKGPWFERAYVEGNPYLLKGVEDELLRQANRQVRAAGAREIIWYVAGSYAASRMRLLFAASTELSRIQVVTTLMPFEKRRTRILKSLPIWRAQPAQLCWELKL